MIRPARLEDGAEVFRLGAAAWPPARGDDLAAMRARVLGRFEPALEEDPGGAWVAEGESGLDGVAVAVRREGIWVLTLLNVHPVARSTGIGGELMARALGHMEGCRGGLIAASEDARGWRLYAGAGFALRPCVHARGRVDLSRAPSLDGLRPGGEEDLEACADVDREIRGGARTVDLRRMLERGCRLWMGDGGYAMSQGGFCQVLAARSEDVAELLLWRVLADTPPDTDANVAWISAGQDWAVRVGHAARLTLVPSGPYFARGELGPLRPWIPNGALL